MGRHDMRAALKAGLLYFGIGFGLGFALGTFRVLVLEPRLGRLMAVLIELPVMLTATWFLCGWLIGRFAVPGTTVAGLAMGGTAFALLMMAEALLAVLAFGSSPHGYVASLLTPAGVAGLTGQVIYALFPVIRVTTGSPNPQV